MSTSPTAPHDSGTGDGDLVPEFLDLTEREEGDVADEDHLTVVLPDDLAYGLAVEAVRLAPAEFGLASVHVLGALLELQEVDHEDRPLGPLGHHLGDAVGIGRQDLVDDVHRMLLVGQPKAASAVGTVPVSRPSTACRLHIKFACEITEAGSVPPHSLRSSVVWASLTRTAP